MENPEYSYIFLNGNPPSPELVRRFCKKNGLRIATDGAYDYCLKLGFTPQILIGDMDSLSMLPDKTYTKVIYNTDINNNDLEKCLIYCKEHKLLNLRIFGSDGKRSDHFLINMATFAAYAKKMGIHIYTNEEYFEFLNPGRYVFPVKPGQRFSLLALETVNGLQMSGSAYTPDHANLEPGSCGLGNICTGKNLEIRFSSGLLLYMSELFL